MEVGTLNHSQSWIIEKTLFNFFNVQENPDLIKEIFDYLHECTINSILTQI